MCYNNPVNNFDLLGMKTREQKEEDRQIARGRQATGKMLNKEKAKQENINKLASQNTSIPTSNIVPVSLNALTSVFDNYLFFSTLQSTTTVYTVIHNIDALCKNAKNEIFTQYTQEGCCIVRFVIDVYHYNFKFERVLAKNGVQITYQDRACRQVCFAEPHIPMREIKYVKLPMFGDNIYLN